LPLLSSNPRINFNENPSSGSRVVPCGQTDRHMAKLFAISRTRQKVFSYFFYNDTINKHGPIRLFFVLVSDELELNKTVHTMKPLCY